MDSSARLAKEIAEPLIEEFGKEREKLLSE
jgi:hypothetical protein